MWKSPEPRFDVACAIWQGGREYQEDAIVVDFPAGADIGIAVLADGMGGHAAGDIASKLVVTEVFSDLKFSTAEHQIPNLLRKAMMNANESVLEHTTEHPKTKGMGSTVVALALVKNRMYHISVGDSPLYLYRNHKMKQINEDHSLAAQIDFMVEAKMLTPEQGNSHPDRNCLTSVILGDSISKVDCPTDPTELQVGDILVISSDGLQYLENFEIERILKKYRRRKAAEIVEHLLQAVYNLADPDQDNLSFAVIKLNHNKPVVRKLKTRSDEYIEPEQARPTRVADSEELEAPEELLKAANE